MRRRDREMGEEFAWGVVDKCEYAFLAMICPDQSPYGIPISIAREDEHIYFHGAMEGQKVEALRDNARVCLTCVGDTQPVESQYTTHYESAVAFGTAVAVTEAAEKKRGLRLICQRHAPTNMARFDEVAERSLSHTAVYRIDVEKITGKCHR